MLVGTPARRFGRSANIVAVAVTFVLLWVFREQLHLDRVGLDPSLVPWIRHPQQDVFDFPPLDSDAVRAGCDATEWDTKSKFQVVFTCENSVGGIGNIRNSVLNCVRYAVLAGGSLVMPRIVVRDESDISQIRTGKKVNLDYMFDREHFVRSLNASCPQLRLFNSSDDVAARLGPPRTWSVGLFPESLIEEEKIPSTGIPHPEKWKEQLHAWLKQIDEKTDNAPTGRPNEGPFVVDLGRSYLTYPIYSDGEAFATTFGNMLKFRSDARELATRAMLRIGRSFFGAHLRTEKDAMENWNPADPTWEWSEYGKQTDAYLDQAARSDLRVVYVASGNATEVGIFAGQAHARGVAVVTKTDLLSGRDLARLGALAWDQQALVDFLVMLGAAQFGGIGHSSFAWNIALKRHLFAQERDHLSGPQMLSDDMSQIYGIPGKWPEYAACLWP
ncbi:hypothetical protein C8035_v000736 [Colletotrichum spinosum]|uniref:Alternative oxidase n=1 Tax=Colletotrichum spinosum TaxID=1347390 RepID=A0A4R8Q1Q2_9PEZI|nr:hypothetical protein C8035_v000736 [Colletotrichum spinosum]